MSSVTTLEAELKSLMIASLDGDAVAYRCLLKRISRHLRAYYKGRLLRMGRSDAEAEDLVQEALIAMHTRRHTYARNEPLTPWVHAIARYKLIDHLRRVRQTWADLPIEDGAAVTARDDHGATESTLDLDKLLARLPRKMRSAVQHTKLEGLSIAEAALTEGMSEAAVKVNVHRALKALIHMVALGNKE